MGELRFPLLAVVVSGGNTELVLMDAPMSFQVIGETKDDAVGECYDKVARILGLPYPGGLPIDQHAQKGKHAYDISEPLKGQKGYDFSYSGLKTAVSNLVNNLRMKGEEIRLDDMCRSFQDVATGMIVDRAKRAAREFGVRQVVLAGGVSANSDLRKRMEEEIRGEGIDLIIPPLWCTTDNAAMIAKVAEHLYEERLFAPLSVAVDPNWRIDKFREF